MRGDPEIYFVTASPKVGELTKEWLDNVNDEGVVYTVDRYMFTWDWTNYGDFYRLKVGEDDAGGLSDVTISYTGVSVSIDLGGDDEDLGSKIINKTDDYGEFYYTGKVWFSIKYQE